VTRSTLLRRDVAGLMARATSETTLDNRERAVASSTIHTARSEDGTAIAYLSLGTGASVLVIPGVLSMAADYAAFARALSEQFAVHIIERRGRGESGPQGAEYSIAKECEDVLAVRADTGAALVVGHSYGGLVALEVARNNVAFSKIAVYEPGVSIDGSMPVDWMPSYEEKLAANRTLDALVEFTLADAPGRLRRMPPWLMKLLWRFYLIRYPESRQMLGLLNENAAEWREIARLDSSYHHYREIAAAVLLMYGGRSDSEAVTLAMERLAAVLPRAERREFPRLDHFRIERTAPREVAMAVSEFFQSGSP
jgi:pimeloyl-ACP methyl ester carboxylesterase